MTVIEDNVEAPPEVKKVTRARKAVKAKLPTPAAGLIAALKFVSVAQKKTGSTGQQFCYMTGHWVAASDGVMTAYAAIEEDLDACPHTFQLIDALSNCGQELAITQLTSFSLAIKSDKFKALVPCVDVKALAIPMPDANIAPIDDRIKDAFSAVAGLCSDNELKPFMAGVLLQANSAVACHFSALLEYWHGVDLPPGLLIPKAAALAVAKAKPALTGFGYSPTSVTFYFENGNMLHTLRILEEFPNYVPVVETSAVLTELPKGFFEAVNAIQSFTETGTLYFDDDVMSTKEAEIDGTSYKIKGLADGMAFDAKLLTAVESHMKTAFFDQLDNRVYFNGGSVRGVVMAIKRETKPVPKVADPNNSTYDDDDIPF